MLTADLGGACIHFFDKTSDISARNGICKRVAGVVCGGNERCLEKLAHCCGIARAQTEHRCTDIALFAYVLQRLGIDGDLIVKSVCHIKGEHRGH